MCTRRRWLSSGLLLCCGHLPWQVSKAVRGTEGVSLSRMAEACLGQPLDKSMQLSSWASRPLSQRHIAYAGGALQLPAHIAC